MSVEKTDPGEHAMRWVAAQIPLLGGTIALPVLQLMLHLTGRSWGRPGWIARPAGALLLLVAFLLFRDSKKVLGTALVATPKPVKDATLRREGVYGRVRHPIYLALMCGTVGWALLWTSLACLCLALCCVVFFAAKARYEEELLRNTFSEYAEYSRDVPALLPRWRRGSQ